MLRHDLEPGSGLTLAALLIANFDVRSELTVIVCRRV